MLEFIPIKNSELLEKYDIKLENLGKSTGFMGCGKKIYLVFDQQKKEWGVTRLDFFQRILRYFGFYQATYKETVRDQLINYPCTLKNQGLTKRIQQIWGASFLSAQTPLSFPQKPSEEQFKKLIDSEDKAGKDESISELSSIFEDVLDVDQPDFQSLDLELCVNWYGSDSEDGSEIVHLTH